MFDTPDTQRLRENVLDWLDVQELDAGERAEQGKLVQNMNYVELTLAFPECEKA